MKKILIISQNKSSRGAFKAAVELGNALKTSTKNKIKFFTEEDAYKDKINYLKIKLFKFINSYIKIVFKGNNKITNTLPQIFKIFDHNRLSSDIILVNYVYEFLSIKDIILFRKPTLIFINDMWFFGGIKHFFSKTLYKKKFKINSMNFYEIFNYFSWKFKMKYLRQNKKLIFVASSNWLKKQATNSVMLKNHKIEKINTPVNVLFWKNMNKKKSRQKLNLPIKKKLILFVAKGGFMNFRKGGDIFLKITKNFKHQDNINFIVLGHSTYKREEFDKNIHYLNFKDDQKKLRDLYNSVDLVFCLSRYENIPYSMIESMSCGTPNISTNVGGINEIILHKKNGWLLKNKNISHIKKSIYWCLNKKNHHKLSKNSVTQVKQNFSYVKILNDYDKLNKDINKDATN
jgi:glycosyltransferase involved in cell wall biosynthesis